jgi:hypothetical protein
LKAWRHSNVFGIRRWKGENVQFHFSQKASASGKALAQEKQKPVTGRALRRLPLVTEPYDQPGTAPKLDIVTVQEPLGLLRRLLVAAADQRLVPCKATVVPNRVCPVLCHPCPITGALENTIPMGNPLTD